MSDILRSLRLFARIAENPNFSAVARQLNVSHTTVARAIDDLEAHFGTPLLDRTTRRLALTRDGEQLLDHALAIVDQVDQAEAELAGDRAARGLVRVGVTTALGLHYAERLTLLRASHPALSVEFVVADWREDRADAGLDLWVRVGDQGQEAATVRPLGMFERVLVAAPAYLDARGVPTASGDLIAHDCILYGYDARPAPWEIDGRRLRVGGCLRTNSSEAVWRAVRGGLGIALLPEIQVRADLAAGTIRRLLPDAAIAPLAISVGHRFAAMRMPVRVRAVLDFLIDGFPGRA